MTVAVAGPASAGCSRAESMAVAEAGSTGRHGEAGYRPLPPPGRLTSRWDAVGEQTIHARVSADPAPPGAAPVVLVHGIGVSSRYWIPTAERLAPLYPVFAPDLPGFGRSSKPKAVLDVPGLANALAAWIRTIGLERPVLIGNSLGCQTIAALAAERPELTRAVVLQGPTFDPHARSALRQVARWLADAPLERPSQGLVLLRDYRDCGFRRAAETFRHGLRDRIERNLPRIPVPALVVRGAKDPIVPQRWAEDAAGLLPHGRLIVIPGAAHTLNYGTPLEFVRVLRPFLDALSDEPAARQQEAPS